ncbi:MAG: hypothetical protein CVU38_13645 [Chloroflexi bacterium HGW-Chloroflexi-1]|nr:MAG: hypothetical protein CVU38_13645 [Chloroflexi bacterium HGW-Chloroflexi-1]
MRKVRFVSVFVVLALLLTIGPSNKSLAGSARGEPVPPQGVRADVPARVPPAEVPDEVNKVGVSETVGESSASISSMPEGLVPRRIPKEQAPKSVKKVESTETVATSFAGTVAEGATAPRAPGTVTLSYGFYWYQYSSNYVAVAAYARTQTDFCATRVYVKPHLYRDVEHDGTWEYMDDDTKEQTGTCVTDSGAALTDYWTAPNNTNWKNYSSHYVDWNGGGEGWERTTYDSFP